MKKKKRNKRMIFIMYVPFFKHNYKNAKIRR